MKRLHRIARWVGLAAAVAGAGSVVRGAWDETAGYLVVLIVASALAGLWEPTE